MSEHFERYHAQKQEAENEVIKLIGETMGYGRIMQLGQKFWREQLEEQGLGGGEFASGPCVSLTVPCGCSSGRCDWCCGAGWLTEHVKAVKDKMDGDA